MAHIEGDVPFGFKAFKIQEVTKIMFSEKKFSKLS